MFRRLASDPRSADVGLLVASLALYVKTLAPTVYIFDSAELAAGAYTLGIVHATGYPLYLLLAKLFTLLVPLGDVAWRVNLFSALCASLTLVLLRRVMFLLSASPASALAAAAMLGVSYPFWSEATAAEVYTLHGVFLTALLWLALRWRETGRSRHILLLALMLGLSFGNHMSTSLLLPALAFFVWRVARVHPITRRAWIAALGLTALGPLTYLYLPLRDAAQPAVNYAHTLGVDLRTLAGVLWMVRGTMFGEFMFGFAPAEIPREVLRFLGFFWDSFLGAGAAVAALGLLDQWRRDRVAAGTLGLVFVVTAAFFIDYRVPDNDTMFLPPLLVGAIWIALGLDGLRDVLAQAQRLRVPPRAFRGAAALLVAAMLIANYTRVDLSRYATPRTYAEGVLGHVLPGAFILGGWLNITPLLYLKAVEGRRPDVELFDWGLYGLGHRAALRARGVPRDEALEDARDEVRLRVRRELLTGRPVYTLNDDGLLSRDFTLVPEGDVLRVCDGPCD